MLEPHGTPDVLALARPIAEWTQGSSWTQVQSTSRVSGLTVLFRVRGKAVSAILVSNSKKVYDMDLVGPYFICIGAQKAGTNWLYDQLKIHPDIWMPPIKELHFFDRVFRVEKIRAMHDTFNRQRNEEGKTHWPHWHPYTAQTFAFLERGTSYDPDIADLDWYCELFRRKRPLVTGDITPAYSALDEATVKMVCMGLPKTKFLFFVRDPIERIWSQLCMIWRRDPGSVDLTTWSSIESIMANKCDILRRSYPTRTVERWSRYLAADKFKVFFFDDLVCTPEVFRLEVLTYLDVDPDSAKLMLPADFNWKATQKKVNLSDAICEKLIALLRDELERCVEVFGGPAHHWAAQYGII